MASVHKRADPPEEPEDDDYPDADDLGAGPSGGTRERLRSSKGFVEELEDFIATRRDDPKAWLAAMKEYRDIRGYKTDVEISKMSQAERLELARTIVAPALEVFLGVEIDYEGLDRTLASIAS